MRGLEPAPWSIVTNSLPPTAPRTQPTWPRPREPAQHRGGDVDAAVTRTERRVRRIEAPDHGSRHRPRPVPAARAGPGTENASRRPSRSSFFTDGTLGGRVGARREPRHVRSRETRTSLDVGELAAEPADGLRGIWHTRDSVTPRISLISASVRPSK